MRPHYPEQDIYGPNHDAGSPSEEWLAGYRSGASRGEAPPDPESDFDADDFRDRHERAFRDHILDAPETHRCDGLCSGPILDRYFGRTPSNEYPPKPAVTNWDDFNLQYPLSAAGGAPPSPQTPSLGKSEPCPICGRPGRVVESDGESTYFVPDAAPQTPSLDAAWKAAEAALPDGWAIVRMEHEADNAFGVAAVIPVNRALGWRWGHGPTPADALTELADRLSGAAR